MHLAGAASMGDLAALERAATDSVVKGFEAQKAGLCARALLEYHSAQSARSPALRALASNAEGVLFLRGSFALPQRDPDGESFSNIFVERHPLRVGTPVMAPWAQDGMDYLAKVHAIDLELGQCTLIWDDGGTTYRVVPLAAVTAVNGCVFPCVAQALPQAVRIWSARRAMLRSLWDYQLQAESGCAHDAFVDLVGICCDAAFAEVRAVLMSRSKSWSSLGLERARIQLQRSRWAAERAYRPDARALAAICLHRGELMRLASAAVVPSAPPSSLAARSHRRQRDQDLRASFQETLQLYDRAAEHLKSAEWKQSHASLNEASWHPPRGHIRPEIVNDLLRAKALADIASRWKPPSPRSRGVHRMLRAGSQRQRVARSGRPPLPLGWMAAASATWAPPEKLVPQTPGLPSSGSAVSSAEAAKCPATAAAKLAWHALCRAAGESSQMDPSTSLWSEDAAKRAPDIAERLGQGSAAARLLLEVAVLIFAMGCEVGQSRSACSLALPLAEKAAKLLAEEDSEQSADDTSRAARHVAAMLAGVPEIMAKYPGRLPRAELLRRGSEGVTAAQEAHQPVPSLRWCWRLVGYRQVEETWILKRGRRSWIQLPAPPPLTWCLEGLALSEATLDLQRNVL